MGARYTTEENVLAEIPGDAPADLTGAKIAAYIEDASRYVDARLPNYACFPDINDNPSTPPVIEKIARLIAAGDCLVFMGSLRGETSSGSELRNIAERMLEHLFGAEAAPARALLDPSEYDYSQTPPREEVRKLDKSSPHHFYSAPISRRDYPSGDVEDF